MITFTARGHQNITANHFTTFEITKDIELSKRGDCIIAVGAKFNSREIIELAKKEGIARLTLSVGEWKEEITGTLNPLFDAEQEIVCRIGEFASSRTLMTRCDKAALQLSREFVHQLQDPEAVIEVKVERVDC